MTGDRLTEGSERQKMEMHSKKGALIEGKYSLLFTSGKSYAISGFTLRMY